MKTLLTHWLQLWLLLALICGNVADVHAQPATPATPESKWTDTAYIRWLEERSMLFQAGQQARAVSGDGVQWRHPYGEP